MNIEQTRGKKPKLSLISAFSYFLKGNMIFALNGLVLYAIDSILHGDAAACMENIMEHCEGERIGSVKTGGIGFHVRNN